VYPRVTQLETARLEAERELALLCERSPRGRRPRHTDPAVVAVLTRLVRRLRVATS
jgi:hypothetical protein